MAVYFDKEQWNAALRHFPCQEECRLISDNLKKIEAVIQKEYGQKNYYSASEFKACLMNAELGFSATEIWTITEYARLGCAKPSNEKELGFRPKEIEPTDVINFPLFVQGCQISFRESGESHYESSPSSNKFFNIKKEAEITRKICSHFISINMTFYTYFLEQYPQKLPTYILRKEIFDAVAVLKIPLSLQEQRFLLNMEVSEKGIPIDKFCYRFETKETKSYSFRGIVEKITRNAIIQDLPLDLSYLEYCHRGTLTQESFNLMMEPVKLNEFELNFVFSFLKEESDYSISQRQIKEKVIDYINTVKDYIIHIMRQELLLEIYQKLKVETERTQCTLRGLFEKYDYNHNSVVSGAVLPVVLSDIHITGLSRTQFSIIFEAGQVNTINPLMKEFNYLSFSENLENTILEEVKRREEICSKIVHELFNIIKKNKLSIFDSYCQFAILGRYGISRLEFVSTLLHLGLQNSVEETQVLWNSLINGTESNALITYHMFIRLFTTRGLLSVTEEEPSTARIESRFIELFTSAVGNTQLFFSLMNPKKQDSVSKTEFILASQKVGIEMSVEDLEVMYSKLEEKEVEGITSKSLFEYINQQIPIEKTDKIKTTLKEPVTSKFEKYEKLIKKLNLMMVEKEINIETVFSKFDLNQDGAISLLEFQELLTYLEIEIPKQEVTELFIDIVSDEDFSMSIVEQALLKLSQFRAFLGASIGLERTQTLSEISQNKLNEELENLYSKIKETLNKKETNLYNIIIKLKIDPLSALSVAGIQKLFECLDLILTRKETLKIDEEIRKAFGKEVYTYQDLLDFFIRRRIETSDLTVGLGNPAIMISLQAIIKELKKNKMSFIEAFSLLTKNRGAYITQIDFIQGIQGMQLGLSKEDIVTLFSHMDKLKKNMVTQNDFLNTLAYKSKESASLQDSSTKSQSQQVATVLHNLGNALNKEGYTLKQINNLFDINGNGVISKSEFTSVMRQYDSLSNVRLLIKYFSGIGDGWIYTSDLMAKIQEILNLHMDGLYSEMQARPIVKRIAKEVEGDISIITDEILKLDKIIDASQISSNVTVMAELANKSGIEKHSFYKVLNQFKVFLTEDEKFVLNTEFGFKAMPSMLDTQKLVKMLESLPEIESVRKQQYTLEWERRIFRKTWNYLRSCKKTVMDVFRASDILDSHFITVDDFYKSFMTLEINLSKREIEALLTIIPIQKDGKLNIREFAKKFYETYLLDTRNAPDMTKEEEHALVFRFIKQLKDKPGYNCERTFAELDRKGVGFLTGAGLQYVLPEAFKIHLTREQLLVILKYMDKNDDGFVSLNEFIWFYNEIENVISQHRKGDSSPNTPRDLTMEDIFESLHTFLNEKNLTLVDVFEQSDLSSKGFLNLEEFTNLLQKTGIMLNEARLETVFTGIDPSFDGKISYKFLYKHARLVAEKKGLKDREDQSDSEIFTWRDKAAEGVVQLLNSINKKYSIHFQAFDSNNDNYLSLREFREAMKALRSQGAKISRNQIDRLLTYFVKNKNQIPSISISKISDFFEQYNTSPFYSRNSSGTEEIMVNEDMFVLIVQHFDGFSVLLNKSTEFYEKIQYVSSHREQFITRGLSLLSNILFFERLFSQTRLFSINLMETLTWLSSFAMQILQQTAFKSAFDSTKNFPELAFVDEPPSEIILRYPIPYIDPSLIKIDERSKTLLPSGCICYNGEIVENKNPIIIHVFSSEVLNKQNMDGKVYWRHLELELAAQRCLYEKDPSLTFKILGKYEKKNGIGEYSIDLTVVYEDIPSSEYLNLEEVLKYQGGLLQVPFLKGTETPLYITKLWASDILCIISLLHESGFTLHTLSPANLFLRKSNSKILIGSYEGIARVDGCWKSSYVSRHKNNNRENFT